MPFKIQPAAAALVVPNWLWEVTPTYSHPSDNDWTDNSDPDTSFVINSLTVELEELANFSTLGPDGSTGVRLVGTGAEAFRIRAPVANVVSTYSITRQTGDLWFLDMQYSVATIGAVCAPQIAIRDLAGGILSFARNEHGAKNVAWEDDGGTSTTNDSGTIKRIAMMIMDRGATSWAIGFSQENATPAVAWKDLDPRGIMDSTSSPWDDFWFRLDTANTTDATITRMAIGYVSVDDWTDIGG